MDFNKLGAGALKYGLILGGISVAFQLLLYIFSVNYFNPVTGILTFLINAAIIVTILIIGGKAYRDKVVGGYINYGEAFLHAILIGAVFGLISGIYSYMFNDLIDPDYMLELSENFMRKMEEKNLSQDQLDKIYENFEKQLNQPVWKRILTGFLGSFIFTVIIGLITSIFIKKRKPVFEEELY